MVPKTPYLVNEIIVSRNGFGEFLLRHGVCRFPKISTLCENTCSTKQDLYIPTSTVCGLHYLLPGPEDFCICCRIGVQEKYILLREAELMLSRPISDLSFPRSSSLRVITRVNMCDNA